MNRSSLGAALVSLAAAAAGVSGCVQNDVQLGSGDSAEVGEWDGYIENYKFSSGSDRFAVHITGLSGGAATGTVRLGNEANLPPPTDPDVGYPADYTWTEASDHIPGGRPYEGFDYTIQGGELTTDRLKGAIYTTEVWAAWCDLQTSYPASFQSEKYACVPNGATKWSDSECTDGGVVFDCNKMSLCQYGLVCACDADGCQWAKQHGYLSFDLQIQDDKAHGSIEGFEGGEFNVWLTRSQGQ